MIYDASFEPSNLCEELDSAIAVDEVEEAIKAKSRKGTWTRSNCSRNSEDRRRSSSESSIFFMRKGVDPGNIADRLDKRHHFLFIKMETEEILQTTEESHCLAL